LLAASFAAAVFAGCSATPATLELLTAARQGLNMAMQAEGQNHAEIMQHLQGRRAALDAAFDSDVRMVAAGQIRDAGGKPVELSADWVIDARRGYSAACGVLDSDAQAAAAAHDKRLDNLRASDEALDMASQLIVQQWSVSERMRQTLIDVQRRLIDGR